MSDTLQTDYTTMHSQLQLTQRDLEIAKAEIARLREHISNINQAHSKDIRLIGEALMEEANSRQWCAEYDEFVSNLNGRLRYDLPVRESEKEVFITYTVKLKFTVDAPTDDDATAKAQEMAEEFMDRTDEIDSYDFEDADVKDA